MIDSEFSVARGTFALDAEIHDEGFICLTGLNGSGKSTVLNVIAGNLKPARGYVRVGSVDVTTFPQEKRGIVLVNPDSYIPHLQVDAHLRWGAVIRKQPVPGARLEQVKRELGIAFTGRVDRLSLGMRERVALGTALLGAPKLILVDEAFSNIDHRENFVEVFRKLCGSVAIDVIHTTQHTSDADMADHHYAIAGGKCARVF